MKLRFGDVEVGQTVIARRPGAWFTGVVKLSRPRMVVIQMPFTDPEFPLEFDVCKRDGWRLETVGVS
jgi:hypothetical protein